MAVFNLEEHRRQNREMEAIWDEQERLKAKIAPDLERLKYLDKRLNDIFMGAV